MIIFSVLLYVIAVAMAFLGISWSVVMSYAGMITMNAATIATLTTWDLVSWAIASLLVIVIALLQSPRDTHRAVKAQGTAYVVTATLAGTLVGMLTGRAGMIIGAVIGAFLGALAFSRTPRGRELNFPSNTFLQYLAARGLPAVVTMCMLAMGLALIIEDNQMHVL